MPGTDADKPTPDDAGGEAAGSNVVAFPGRIHLVVEVSAPGAEDAVARLDQALLALAQALAGQREGRPGLAPGPLETWRAAWPAASAP